MYWITRVSMVVEEKFQWMTERSPVTLLRGEEVKVCRAELLFDMSSSSHKRLSQTSAVDLRGPGGRHISYSNFAFACGVPFFSLLFFISHSISGLEWRKFYWVISWFIWYFYFNEDERWWSWSVNKSIWNSEVSMWILGVGFMHPSHSSQAWGNLWCMRHDTVTFPQNDTFPNSYIFSSDTSFSAVALHEITQFCWFLKKTQKLADIMTEDIEQGAIYPTVTARTILQMYLEHPYHITWNFLWRPAGMPGIEIVLQKLF